MRTVLFITLFISLHAFGQVPLPEASVGYVEFVQIKQPDGTVHCFEYERSQDYINTLAAGMSRSGMKVIPQTVGRRHSDGRLMKSQTGLDIVLRGTTQLTNNPAAVAAFAAAAARWEERLMNPVTVTIDVDYGTTRFGEPWSSANVLGSTSSAVFSLNSTTWRQYANALLAQNPQYSYIYNNIPDTLFNSTVTINPKPSGTLANLQAIGLKSATDALPFGSAPSIGFNSNFTFDLDPADGITPGQTDFDGVAVHEIGHALGFVSAIGSTGTARTWDIFRFRPGTVTDTVNFITATRILTPGPNPNGGDQVFWDGFREWEVSTATGSRLGGDGQQASHWRDDAQRTAYPVSERKIGIMDPNIGSGIRDTITLADLKALSIMGWSIDLGNIINPVEKLTAGSNYTTPNAITLSWTNPLRNFGGHIIASYKIAIYRNGMFQEEIVSPAAGSNTVLIDSNLTEYQSYTYRFVPVHLPSNDSGIARTIIATAGGSPRPAAGKFISVRTNQSTVYAKFQIPGLHDDNTLLHNLNYAKFYRNTATQANVKDSLPLSTPDTGKAIYVIDTPGPRFLNNYNYLVSFVGEAPFHAEGISVATPTVKAGIVLQTEYSESFESSRASVIADDGWDSSNVASHNGSQAFGILSYPNNYSGAAYIPMIRGNGSPMIRFWTVCRIEPNDSARIQISRNRGVTWNTVLTLNENSHAEWKSGLNVWFKKEIHFTGYEPDTILVRFLLKSDNTASGFGWLVDDISLSPVLTSVASDLLLPPAEYSLEQNYPNPFNPSTSINYLVKEKGLVQVKVYDIVGKEIAVLVNKIQDRGRYQTSFDAGGLSSGMYFYKLSVNGFTNIKKMIYLR